MRASRLLSILLSLQARGRLTASGMAEELEVSERTIYRDIDQLSAAGIPVIADRGRAGGFKLAEGFRTQLTGFTEGEAEALFLTGLPGPAAELGLSELMAMARAKLLAALPAGARAARVAERFHLDPAGWFRSTEPVTALPVIARAVWNERYLSFRYGPAGKGRKVGPIGVVLKAGVWYLVAQKGGAFRTYRVGRMSETEALAEAYVRPKSFDLAAWWANASREYEVASYRGSAVIGLSPRGRALIDMLGPYVAQACAQTAGAPDEHRWVRCTIPIESPEYGVRELMRLGGDVEVVSPPALRARMAQTLREALQRYSARTRPVSRSGGASRR
ncbi:MAG TPA: WYL domain-containing protein [Casimicrobiaceae bacterium]|nr:WYL domain-containing protein [Casimicrobiaceae bacterium]